LSHHYICVYAIIELQFTIRVLYCIFCVDIIYSFVFVNVVLVLFRMLKTQIIIFGFNRNSTLAHFWNRMVFVMFVSHGVFVNNKYCIYYLCSLNATYIIYIETTHNKLFQFFQLNYFVYLYQFPKIPIVRLTTYVKYIELCLYLQVNTIINENKKFHINKIPNTILFRRNDRTQ
jgi:hypothetical protein